MSAPAATAAAAPEDGSKKRKEPSAQEVAQAAFMDNLFTREKSSVMQAARATLEAASKKIKLENGASSSSNEFVNAMDKNASAAAIASRAIQPFTDNGAVSHSTTKSSNLDLFYHLMRNYDAQALLDLLPQCWEENPEIMLQVLLHGRDCHGKGKGERLVVYYSLLWLRANKPKTYLLNLLNFLRAGYFKDLLQIVELLESRSIAPTKHWKPVEAAAGAGAASSGKKKKAVGGKRGGSARPPAEKKKVELEPVIVKLAQAAGGSSSPVGSTDLELSLLAEYLKADFVSMKKWRAARRAFLAAKKGASPSPAPSAASADNASWYEEGDFQTKTTEDGWEEVSDASSNISKLSINDNYMSDVPSTTSASSAASSSSSAPAPAAPAEVVNGVTNPGQLFLSLAAKYAPSEGKHFGSSAKRIAAMLFAPEGASLKSNGFSNKKHEQACLKKYRQMLSALRMQLNLIERKICKGLWNKINFNAVPSRCHLLLKKAFARHTPEAYTQYLEGLKKGKGKINVVGLEPHQLVKNYISSSRELEETVEAAWRALVEKTRECGTFKSAVSIIDVSGSMSGTPMEVAISMGLMISALSEGPFKGRCLTFDANPQWHTITGETLRDQVQCLQAAPWGGNTDLIKSFDLILSIAVNNKIPQSQLPQTLFIFSDMQFDEAMGNDWMKTNHQAIKDRFEAAGYKLPNIVYWNVNGELNKDAPVTMDTPGCALMAGFSADLFKVFLSTPMEELMALSVEADPEKKKADPLSPLNIMMKAIESYRVEVEESER